MSKMDLTISKRLKDCRKYNKMSLECASKKIEVSKQTLIDYEQGKGNPSLSTISKICKAYNISPNYLFTGNDDNVSKMDDLLKRKAYMLVSLMVDKDIVYIPNESKMVFKNNTLKEIIGNCHYAIYGSTKLTKLEILEKVLEYLNDYSEETN